MNIEKVLVVTYIAIVFLAKAAIAGLLIALLVAAIRYLLAVT